MYDIRYDNTMASKFSFSSAIQWTIITVLGLTPVFFLPVTQNFYDTNKWMLLVTGAVMLLLFWAVMLFQIKKPLRIQGIGPILGYGALTVASFIGLAAASTNKIEAVLSPLGPVTFISLTILTIGASGITKQGKTWLKRFLYGAAGILGLIALYQSLGMGKLMFPHTPFLADPLWTPTGSVPSTIVLFVIALSLLIPDIITAVKKRHEHSIIALLVTSLIIIIVGSVITLWQFIPKAGNMLPFNAGWTVAAQIFRSPVPAATGVGAENFITAFTMGRPASLNMTQLSSVNFTTSTDFFLHVLTVYGLVGLAAALILVINLFSGSNRGWMLVTKLATLAGLLLAPPTITLLTVVAAILVLSYDNEKHTPKQPAIASWLRITAGGILFLAAATGGYFAARAYTAEVYFFRSLLAAAANNGTGTYNLQIKAIEANTFLSRYHITYSQTSLSLANSIASSLDNNAVSTQSGTKNDQDRQLIGQLVQQAIREAKIAVTLNDSNVAAWENLGLTYQTIIPVATGADSWAITAYQSAAQLDPSNPTLFLNIGGVFVHQKKYDNAIAAFKRSIQLNPSYANAYYNLANAYELNGDSVDAADALTKTLTLVEPGSTDYYKVKNELDALAPGKTPANIPPSSATGPSQLTLP